MTRRIVVLLLVLLVAPTSGRAQSAKAPTLADANALLASSKNEEAAAAFRALIRADGHNLNAWLGLGQAQENLGQPDQALASYAKVIELSPSPVYQTRAAMMSIAGVYAVRGDRDHAFEWLAKLADSHPTPIFLATVTSAKEFTSIKDDARFAAAIERLTPCGAPEYHQFDFWIGSWDVQNVAGQTVGHNDVTRLVDGCVLQEHWASARLPERGTSFNFYDYRDKQWHQSYHDNSGNIASYPPLAGGLRDGKMVLLSPPGVQPLSRWTWYALPGGKVRQTAEQSSDGGKTWTVIWDAIYVKA